MSSSSTIGHEVIRFLEQARTENLKRASYVKSYRGLSVFLSFGQGRTAAIPWMGFFGAGQKPSEGVYPVLLYHRVHELLILAYGVSETRAPSVNWQLASGQITVGQYLSENNLTLSRYNQSFVFRIYKTDELVLDSLEADINKLIDEYYEQLGLIAKN